MSEANILNPSTTSALNPDFPVGKPRPIVASRYQGRSGKPSMRRLSARGKIHQLTWSKRLLSDMQALDQWFSQYENDFFTYADWERGRYYSGMVPDEGVQFTDEGHNQVTVTAQFIEVPGLNMFQYPSAWGLDSIFMEERNGFGDDLFKLTGPWSYHGQNLAHQSESLNLSPWAVSQGCTVTADQVADPNGNVTADLLTSGNLSASACFQVLGALTAQTYTLSAYVRAGTATQLMCSLFDTTAGAHVAMNGAILSGAGAVTSGVGPITVSGLGTGWTRVALTSQAALIAGHNYEIIFYPNSTAVNTLTNYVWGVQVEAAAAASIYTRTTSVSPSYHGTGFAYFDAGANTADLAEAIYFGYGFRLWSPAGPDMGIVQVSLDSVVQGTVDLYNAAPTSAAVMFTLQNVPLGHHRVKLAATNTKNASSLAYLIAADAIEVMR